MQEINSDAEKDYIRYLIKKYVPGLKSQGKELPTIMFDNSYIEEEST